MIYIVKMSAENKLRWTANSLFDNNRKLLLPLVLRDFLERNNRYDRVDFIGDISG